MQVREDCNAAIDMVDSILRMELRVDESVSSSDLVPVKIKVQSTAHG